MKRFNRILCVVGPEKNSDTAISQSIKIANDHQASITFLSVIAGKSRRKNPLNNNDELTQQRRSTIEEKISTLAPSLKANIEIHSGIGYIQIIKSVIKNKNDLVVKCAEDSDWLSRMFGSEDMHLMRKCPCPVLMLKPGKKDGFRHILATVDVSDDSNEDDKERVQEKLNKQVLEYSASLSMAELTTLHVGSVWEAYAEDFYRYGAFSRLPENKVDQYVDQVRSECSDKLELLVKEMDDMLGRDALQYLQPNVHLVNGKVSKEIPLMVAKYDIDLIVMGTVGRIGIPGLIIGNTAESILEQVKCSVLAIKPEGFETPVK